MTRAFKPMVRVSRGNLCPVCARPDWCLVAPDGSAAICPRVESDRRIGDAGYLHLLGDSNIPRRRIRTIHFESGPLPDFGALSAGFRNDLGNGPRDTFATSLGLSVKSLELLGVGWVANRRAFSFPMTNPDGRVVGVLLRTLQGDKSGIRGSKAGLFLPATSSESRHLPLLVSEGPTDAAALLDLGYPHVVGRPGCGAGASYLFSLVRTRRPPEVIVVADADAPGLAGAQRLAAELTLVAPCVRIAIPPGGTKDVRGFLQRGGTRGELDRQIAGATAFRIELVVTFKESR